MKLAIPVEVRENVVRPLNLRGSRATPLDEIGQLYETIDYIGKVSTVSNDTIVVGFDNGNFNDLYLAQGGYRYRNYYLVCTNPTLEDIKHAILVRLIRPTNDIIALSANTPSGDCAFITYDDKRVLYSLNGKLHIKNRL